MTSLHRLSRNATQPAVGRDVEAWCSKCNHAMTHVIVAMVGLEIVKVRCNTCSGEHKFKSLREVAAESAKPEREKKASAPRKLSVKAATKASEAQAQVDRSLRLLHERAMADRDRATAVPYTAGLQPRPGLLIDHKLFGYGIVDAVFEGKSRFLFQDGYKVLVTGKEAG